MIWYFIAFMAGLLAGMIFSMILVEGKVEQYILDWFELKNKRKGS